MDILLQDESGNRRVQARIETEMVMHGSCWFPGLVIDEPTFVAECAAYAVNEGRVLFDVWAPDDEDEVVTRRFSVAQVSSAELAALRLLGATAPSGAEIRTETGIAYRVVDGLIVSGTTVLGSMDEIDEAFTLTADLTTLFRPN